MKLSVLMITYNHQKFIAKAVHSALQQQTDFEYEIVIGDDFSVDGTREILRDLQCQHPSRIRLVFPDRHVGMHRNFQEAYRTCQGTYIAMLEGDDHWISPYKLQRQVDFLDNHPDAVICFHNALIVYDDGTPEGLYCPADQKEVSELGDMLMANFIPVCAAVFRNNIVTEFPEWAFELLYLDWVMNLLLAQHGKIYYLKDTMSVYKRHGGGVWSGAGTEAKIRTTVLMYHHMNALLNYKYDAMIQALIPRWIVFHQLEEAMLRLKDSERRREEQVQLAEKRRLTAIRKVRRGWKRAEEEWRRQFERLDLERASALNEAQARVHSLSREKEAAEMETERLRQVSAQHTVELEALSKSVKAWAEREGQASSMVLSRMPKLGDQVADLSRRTLLSDIRHAACATVPVDAQVLVVSKGDDALLRLDGRTAAHFPQTERGGYAGYHPGNSAEAIAHLERLREKGAAFLLFPSTAFWWLEFYSEFRSYLDLRYQRVWDNECCVIYRLTESRQSDAAARSLRGAQEALGDESRAGQADMDATLPHRANGPLQNGGGAASVAQSRSVPTGTDTARQRLLQRLRQVAQEVLPTGVGVLVASQGDEEMLQLEGRNAWHFPQSDTGAFSDREFANDSELLVHLEAVRLKGAGFLVIPLTALGWLNRYPDFKKYLDACCRQMVRDESVGLVYGLFQCVPDGFPLPPPELVYLVTNQLNGEAFYWWGVMGAECIKGALYKNRVDIAELASILDFGCGCGRVLRQWKDLTRPKVYGVDYNPVLLDWCKAYLPFAEYSLSQLRAPLDYPTDKFEFIYAISVFTHLGAELQEFWMGELGRVLRPGGHLLITVHGTTRLPVLTADERIKFDAGEMIVRNWEQSGTNNCATFHPEKYVREVLAKGFEVVDFIPGGSKDADQDMFLLRKPSPTV